MNHLWRLIGVALAALVVAGCGQTTEQREPNLNVRSTQPAKTPERVAAEAATPGSGARQVRVAVVTHGQASDPFWAVVRTGINHAARQMGVAVTYSAPDTYDPQRMKRLIEQAITRKPDGLVVTIPDPKVIGGAIRDAERAGIPVISINSGTQVWQRYGVLMHIGQPDDAAGKAAGERLAAAGVRNALCVDQEVGNSALGQRCKAFAAELHKVHGRSTVIDIDLQNRAAALSTIAAAIQSHNPDGVLTLGPAGAEPALTVLRQRHLTGKVKLATFDLSPAVIDAVRNGQISFAIDQQPYLQGYLPIVYFAQFARYGVLPDRDRVDATGPSFVTKQNAGAVQRLAEAGIR